MLVETMDALNRWIAKAMGYDIEKCLCGAWACTHWVLVAPDGFRTARGSQEAAWEVAPDFVGRDWLLVVEAMRKRGYHFTITDDDDLAAEKYCCTMWMDTEPCQEYGEWGDTIAKAVCLAAKDALEASKLEIQ